MARGRSRFDSRNSTKFVSLRRIGCWATRLTNLSKAKRLLAMNSFSDVLWSVVTSSRLPAPPPLPFPPPPSKELEAIFTRVVPTRLFSGAGGMMRPRGPCFSAIFSWRPAKYCSVLFLCFLMIYVLAEAVCSKIERNPTGVTRWLLDFFRILHEFPCRLLLSKLPTGKGKTYQLEFFSQK